MGRILKKKDPLKKKALRLEKANRDASHDPEGTVAVAAKPTAASKTLISQITPKTAVLDNNLIQKVFQFLREVKIELKKVTWPSRKQTMGSTVVVIVLVMIISIFLGVVDFGLSSLIRIVLP
jgi:preprotein translocase subunit SecE